jgi:hypothetical protein
VEVSWDVATANDHNSFNDQSTIMSIGNHWGHSTASGHVEAQLDVNARTTSPAAAAAAAATAAVGDAGADVGAHTCLSCCSSKTV